MNIKNIIRKCVFYCLNEHQVDFFYKIYYKVFYKNEMRKKVELGNLNSDKIFYVIRPREDCVEGLLSLFWNVVRNIDYALENKYIPVVDFQNYKTQYFQDENENSWEYYFTQPNDYPLNEIYNSKNVILSGLESQWYKKEKYKACYDAHSLKILHQEIFNSIDFSDEVKSRVKKEICELNIDLRNTIGLYLRGTDYIKLKPSGHPVQPNVEQAISVVDKFLKKYNLSKIFLVTEDGEIYDAIKKKYGENCITPRYDRYIYDYDGKKFLSKDASINDLADTAYERGMRYLIKMIILSKCNYLIGGNTNGMWAVNVFAENEFKDKYIFELGVYGK